MSDPPEVVANVAGPDNEIEITPAMTEAGVAMLESYLLDDSISTFWRAEAVEEIFRAMRRIDLSTGSAASRRDNADD
jgi:hypothetical protein